MVSMIKVFSLGDVMGSLRMAAISSGFRNLNFSRRYS